MLIAAVWLEWFLPVAFGPNRLIVIAPEPLPAAPGLTLARCRTGVEPATLWTPTTRSAVELPAPHSERHKGESGERYQHSPDRPTALHKTLGYHLRVLHYPSPGLFCVLLCGGLATAGLAFLLTISSSYPNNILTSRNYIVRRLQGAVNVYANVLVNLIPVAY